MSRAATSWGLSPDASRTAVAVATLREEHPQCRKFVGTVPRTCLERHVRVRRREAGGWTRPAAACLGTVPRRVSGGHGGCGYVGGLSPGAARVDGRSRIRGVVNPPGLSSPWTAEPLVLALAAVAVVCFAQGFVRLRRRGRADHAPWTRALLFALGLAALVLPLVSPLDAARRPLPALGAHAPARADRRRRAGADPRRAARAAALLRRPDRAPQRCGRTRRLRRFASWLCRPAVALVVWALAFGALAHPGRLRLRRPPPGRPRPRARELRRSPASSSGALLIDPARHGRALARTPPRDRRRRSSRWGR